MNPTTCAIVATIIALTYPISVVFITIITEGCVIARAILAPIALILNAGSAITITVSSVVATITSERVIFPATLAPILVINIIPTIVSSAYAFAVFAQSNATITHYLITMSSERIVSTYLLKPALTTSNEFIIIVWHYLTPLGVIVALSYHTFACLSNLSCACSIIMLDTLSLRLST
jgi:hypothetical protein